MSFHRLCPPERPNLRDIGGITDPLLLGSPYSESTIATDHLLFDSLRLFASPAQHYYSLDCTSVIDSDGKKPENGRAWFSPPAGWLGWVCPLVSIFFKRESTRWKRFWSSHRHCVVARALPALVRANEWWRFDARANRTVGVTAQKQQARCLEPGPAWLGHCSMRCSSQSDAPPEVDGCQSKAEVRISRPATQPVR